MSLQCSMEICSNIVCFSDHCKVQSKFSKSIINPISKMLFNNGKDEADYLKTGELYYAELHPDFERKMYKIEKPEYKKLKLNNIPKMFVFKKLF